jgi:ribosomal protein S13
MVRLSAVQRVGFLQVAALLNERYKVGDELKRSIRDDILRLIEAKTYR